MIMEAAGGAQGEWGVVLVVWDRPQVWSVESMRFHVPNVVIWEVVTDGKQTLNIGAYLPNSILENLPDLEEDLTRFQDQDHIVLGDINSNTIQAENPRNQQVAVMLPEIGMIEFLYHLRQYWWFWHMKTWYQGRQGRVIGVRGQ